MNAKHFLTTAICMALAAILWPRGLFGGVVETRRIVLPAAKAFEEGEGVRDVRLNESGAIILYDRLLVEDDGPGMGSDADWLKTDRAPTTEIAGDVRVKKTLHIDHLRAAEARLVVPPGLGVEINGHAVESSADAEFLVIAPTLLAEGDNEIVLSSPDGKARTIKIAPTADILRNAPERKSRPRRSFKSVDAGKTWAPIDGEYMVRLHLIQYAPRGEVVSPVMELGGTMKGHAPLLAPVDVQAVELSADADAPDGSKVDLAFRAGINPVFDATTWTAWTPAGAEFPAGARYMQWKATLSSDDPFKTPALRSVAVKAQINRARAPDWAAALSPGEYHNEQIRYTSMPFEYENPRHPKMVALRKKYKLDEIVSGGATETERLARLRDWIAHQWKICAPEVNYPAWDADEILTRKYGFCVQYAVTMMQCAISLGYQARFVFGNNPGAFDGGGHEVCEIWSNEHRKWMLFDVNQDWHYVNARTRQPMSMLEVHDLVVKTYYNGQLATPSNAPQQRVRADNLAICYGPGVVPGTPPEEFARHFVDGHYTAPTRWLLVNYIPRNNFYAKPYPRPKTQGADWNWSDYWCWEDAATPKRWLYRNFTARRSDLNWTLNQVCFDATVKDQPGVIAVQMGTFTPFFNTYLINVNREGWKESDRTFEWNLRSGRNRLEMRVRNTSGILGPISSLELEM
jgi:hypothetical protein